MVSDPSLTLPYKGRDLKRGAAPVLGERFKGGLPLSQGRELFPLFAAKHGGVFC